MVRNAGATCLLCLGMAAWVLPVSAQQDTGPNVLIVVAHPDDDAMFSAAIYKITHALGGNVDLVLVTDGSGGYRYSQLAEPIYGLELTDERVARQHLPAIRKRELMAGGEIVGIRNYFFLDQYDHAYTENVDTVLAHVWDTDDVRRRLTRIMQRVSYDFVFVHLPIPNFHAHHQAASILALQAAGTLADGQRPVVLGSLVGSRADTARMDFRERPGFPITRIRDDVGPFIFDRTEPLSPDGRLDYRIIVNWVIAEHKSQGTMQLLVNRGDSERFWVFAANGPNAVDDTRRLFHRLGEW